MKIVRLNSHKLDKYNTIKESENMNTNVELTLKWNDFSETSELSQDRFNEIMLDIDKDEILSIELQDNILKVTVSNFELYLEAYGKEYRCKAIPKSYEYN